jgi:hypothetical protein
MKRIYPKKRNPRREKKILNRMEKQKRSANRQHAKFMDRIDRANLKDRLEWLKHCSQEEAQKRLMRDLGMDPFGDGFDIALGMLSVHIGRRKRKRREEERVRQELIDEALKDGKIVTTTTNGEVIITENIKIPEGVVVIHSPRVSFGEEEETN